MDIQYWENYYKNRNTPFERSDFAHFVSQYLRKGDSLLDCGCGNGRDSVFFNQIGCKVTAIDQCESIILDLQKSKTDISFIVDDFTSPSIKKRFDIVYSRFALHSVTEQDENRFIEWCKSNTKKYLFNEARSDFDGEPNNTTHFRRNINMNSLLKKIEGSFDIRYSSQSNHFSPVKKEYDTEDKKDPFVLRVVARQKQWR